MFQRPSLENNLFLAHIKLYQIVTVLSACLMIDGSWAQDSGPARSPGPSPPSLTPPQPAWCNLLLAAHSRQCAPTALTDNIITFRHEASSQQLKNAKLELLGCLEAQFPAHQSLIHSLTQSLTFAFIQFLSQSLTRSFVGSLTHALLHLFTWAPTRS